MSLPPYLLERLKRRKIITEETVKQQNSNVEDKLNIGDEEEIIAEDHSDHSDEESREDSSEVPESDGKEKAEECKEEEEEEPNLIEEHEFTTESVIGCPNKYNIYHDCNQYCVDNYSNPENVKPTIEQRKQLALLLRTFPITNEWTVVFDPGVKTFYFWNILTNLVSWVPPAMNGFISLPADRIRKSMKELEQS